jgi:hypothetical protein
VLAAAAAVAAAAVAAASVVLSVACDVYLQPQATLRHQLQVRVLSLAQQQQQQLPPHFYLLQHVWPAAAFWLLRSPSLSTAAQQAA